MLEALPVEVPQRGPLRLNAHRERFCLVAALRWLARVRPSLFPAKVARDRINQSPDFVLTPVCGAPAIGIEQCDAGLRLYQRWLDRSDDQQPELFPSPNGDGWVGDGPERSFVRQVALAICRKRKSKVWRDAPAGSSRLILVYDNTSTSFLIHDSSVPNLLARACARARRNDPMEEAVLLVRSQERVFAWDATAEGLG